MAMGSETGEQRDGERMMSSGNGEREADHGNVRGTVFGGRFTVYAIRYTVHTIRYTLYGVRYTVQGTHPMGARKSG